MEKVCEFAQRFPVEKIEGWENSSQREVLKKLFKIPFITDNFWLTGGTCLSAMYLGHRQSEDLDLFTTCESIHPNDIQKITDILKAQFEFQMPAVQHPSFVSIKIDNTKVDFVSDMFAYKGERLNMMLDGVPCKVDRWDNLCVAKFSAFLSRVSDKDILDVGAILKTSNNDTELKKMCKFLIYETRKRDSIADELENIVEIVSYASTKIKNLSYKGILLKFRDILTNFEREISTENMISPPTLTPQNTKTQAEEIKNTHKGYAEIMKEGDRINLTLPSGKEIRGTITNIDCRNVAIKSGSAVSVIKLDNIIAGKWLVKLLPPLRDEETLEYAQEKAKELMGPDTTAEGAINGKTYKGKIVGMTEMYAIQSIGKNKAVLHRLEDMTGVNIQEGDSLSISRDIPGVVSIKPYAEQQKEQWLGR